MRGYRAVTAVIAATVIVAAGTHFGGQGSGGPVVNGVVVQTANAWVNPGSAGASPSRSASPAAYDSTHAYGTMTAACTAASPGDTIRVQSGTFAGQTFLNSTCNGTSGNPITFTPATGATVSFTSSVTIGNSTTSDSAQAPAQYLTFNGDNGSGHGFQLTGGAHFIGFYNDAASRGPDHITIENWNLCVAQPDSGNGCIRFSSPNALIVQNNTLGPICCGMKLPDQAIENNDTELIDINLATTGDPQPTNVQITDNLLQGEARNCTYYPTGFGSCPQSRTCTTCHGDAIHVWGETGMVISRNRIYNTEVQAIFFEQTNGGKVNDGTVTDNLIDCGSACSDATAGIYVHPGSAFTPDTVGTGHTWNIKFNTVMNNGIRLTPDNGAAGIPAGMVFNIIGNIVASPGVGANITGSYSTGHCTGGSGTWTYRYNVWGTNGATPGFSCDATDVTVADASVLVTQYQSSSPNGHLAGAAGSTSADDLVPTSVSGGCTATDVDGDTRPHNTNCDAGADER